MLRWPLPMPMSMSVAMALTVGVCMGMGMGMRLGWGLMPLTHGAIGDKPVLLEGQLDPLLLRARGGSQSRFNREQKPKLDPYPRQLPPMPQGASALREKS